MSEESEKLINENCDDNNPNHNKKLSKVNNDINVNSLSSINLFDANQLAVAENLISKIMRSKKSGIDSVNDGLAILLRAKDLNLPFSTCVEHIHCINGKTGIDIHIIKALLLKAGCTWDCTKDYQPLYEYTDGFNVFVDGSFPNYVVKCNNVKEFEDKIKNRTDSDIIYVYPVKWYKDFNGSLYKEYQLNSTQFTIVINKAQAMEVMKNHKVPVYRVPNNPVDYVTEYKITRMVNGTKMVGVGHFSYNDANQAEMFEKDTYKKYPRILIGHRAFTLAAREIASDLLLGCMETTELKIVESIDLNNKDVISVEDAEIID